MGGKPRWQKSSPGKEEAGVASLFFSTRRLKRNATKIITLRRKGQWHQGHSQQPHSRRAALCARTARKWRTLLRKRRTASDTISSSTPERPTAPGWVGPPARGPERDPRVDELQGFWTPSPSGLQRNHDEPAPLQLHVFQFLVCPGVHAHDPVNAGCSRSRFTTARDSAAHGDVDRQLGAVVQWESRSHHLSASLVVSPHGDISCPGLLQILASVFSGAKAAQWRPLLSVSAPQSHRIRQLSRTVVRNTVWRHSETQNSWDTGHVRASAA